MNYKKMKKAELLSLLEIRDEELVNAKNGIAEYSEFYSQSENENAKLSMELEAYTDLNLNSDSFYKWYCLIDDVVSLTPDKISEELFEMKELFRKISKKLS